MNNNQLSDCAEALASRMYDMGVLFEDAAGVFREVKGKWDYVDQFVAHRAKMRRQAFYEALSTSWLPDRVAWWVSKRWSERWWSERWWPR